VGTRRWGYFRFRITVCWPMSQATQARWPDLVDRSGSDCPPSERRVLSGVNLSARWEESHDSNQESSGSLDLPSVGPAAQQVKLRSCREAGGGVVV
jgi:hypothetical protein